MTEQQHNSKDFATQYIDLLSERVGGRALSCSDEWFAPCSNLVKSGRGVFKEGYFVDTGQWMDGWESRRSYDRKDRIASGLEYDWCILRLGIPGVIYGFDIDTNHFRGNAAEFVMIEGANESGEVDKNTQWTEILSKSATDAHSQNLFTCENKEIWTHLRLRMYPDGGIARFRAYGKGQIIKENFIEGELIDLASVKNGGKGIAASDMFYSSPSNLVMPERGINMGDGWETKRRRDPSNDWAIIELGLMGTIRKVLIDTAHFKGNFPDRFSLEATNINLGTNANINNSDSTSKAITSKTITSQEVKWQTIISERPLYADREHLFVKEIESAINAEFTHVRINIFPDGGISRLRIWGFPNWTFQTEPYK